MNQTAEQKEAQQKQKQNYTTKSSSIAVTINVCTRLKIIATVRERERQKKKPKSIRCAINLLAFVFFVVSPRRIVSAVFLFFYLSFLVHCTDFNWRE